MIRGQVIEILPAYNAETGARDIFDEYALCEARIVDASGRDVLVAVKAAGEAWVSRSRIKLPRII